jgi:vacuolar-type H+-ATPase subunit F/Vma7
MSETSDRLIALCKVFPKFLRQGGLCVGLVVTQTAKEKGLPLNPEALRTEGGGQVAGLGKAAVQKILEAHQISKVLAEEGGRTSRGSLGLMKVYVEALNELHSKNKLDLDAALAWWIDKVRGHFASKGTRFHFDPGKSLRANIEDILDQAGELQTEGGGANYVGAMLQHLVGAKLEFVVGEGKFTHYGFSVADQSTARQADYEIENTCIHVTTHPSEALARKCAENLGSGMRPIIVTLPKSVQPAEYLLESAGIADRVDVLDAAQFLTANVYERSLFKAAECKITLTALLDRYNAIIARCETDPSLLIKMPR